MEGTVSHRFVRVGYIAWLCDRFMLNAKSGIPVAELR